MEIRYFAHSWLSDWNHGNAHFLRGLASALVSRGHGVRLYEAMPEARGGWSLAHLRAEPRGAAAIAEMRAAYPELRLRAFGPGATGAHAVSDWRDEMRTAELVIVHEWNPPELFAWLVRQRRRWEFRLLLHDTHHRALSEAAMLDRLPLPAFDGVLAFGESLRRIYESRGVRHSFTFHEAADTRRFFPRNGVPRQHTLIWIGNWGDDERTRELEEFLLRPAEAAQLSTVLYGVRYPPAAASRLVALDMSYGGYLPNLRVPAAYAAARIAVHIPRRPYTAALPGIPTIRVFEALACAMPLVCAPWNDTERLFEPGMDYWVARNGKEMQAMLEQLAGDPGQRSRLGAHGAATVAACHTCAHRARQLEAICRELD